MAERPWVLPAEVKEYTENKDIQQRADIRLSVDISRAEARVIAYCNNRFEGSESIPQPVKTAVILLAEAYASNAITSAKPRIKSETFDDYSYTADSPTIDIEGIDLGGLLDDYCIVQPANAVTLRMRRL